MNKLFLVFMFLLIVMPFISSEDIGTYEVNKEMQLTNYCEAGVCTFVELISLEHPNGTIQYINSNMTKNGQAYNYSFTPTNIGEYSYVTCGDSLVEICDRDTFFVNLNGQDNSIGVMITLLLFFILIFGGYYELNRKVNYDKWYNNILNKYENRNYVKLIYSSVGYNIIKNKLGIYYFIIFPIIVILTDIVMSYNITSLLEVFKNVLFVYSFGIILIAVSFFGQFQEFIYSVIKDSTNNSWGIKDE